MPITRQHLEYRLTMGRMDSTGANPRYGAGLHAGPLPAAAAEDEHRALILQARILETIARGASRDAVLAATCGLIEAIDTGAIAGVLILSQDAQRFTHVVAPSIPAGLLQALSDWPVASNDHRCTCAVAVLQNEVTATLDIAADPRWSEPWRSLTQSCGIHACLSYPIYRPSGAPLGSLFVAYPEPVAEIERWDLDLIGMGARLAELALEREHANCELRELQERFDAQAPASRERANIRDGTFGSVTPAWSRSDGDLRSEPNHRQRVEATLTQMQRLEALGQLTAGVAHDFNNLLTVVLGNLDYIERRADQWATHSTQFARRLSFARVAAEHGAKLIAQLLAFSRRQQLEAKVLDPNGVIAGMHHLLQSTLSTSIDLELALSEDLWHALVDPTQLELVILNLTINARDAMQAGGRLGVQTYNACASGTDLPVDLPMGDYVVVSVSDTGTGMTDEVRSRAFDPFFTTKDVGHGSGLGLAQVYGFAKQSGGSVTIETQVDHGTTVRVFVPRAVHAAAGDSPQAAHWAQSLAGKRVLLVDDDPAVRQVAQAMLTELGCEVVEASSGPAALEILRSNADVDALVADFAMPGMNGARLARRATAQRPQLPALIITGYADSDELRRTPAAVLCKPFRREQLADKLIALLGAS